MVIADGLILKQFANQSLYLLNLIISVETNILIDVDANNNYILI